MIQSADEVPAGTVQLPYLRSIKSMGYEPGPKLIVTEVGGLPSGGMGHWDCASAPRVKPKNNNDVKATIRAGREIFICISPI